MKRNPLKRMANVLIKRSGGGCRNFTNLRNGKAHEPAPLGECFRNKMRVLSRYSADQACESCLAHRALVQESRIR